MTYAGISPHFSLFRSPFGDLFAYWGNCQAQFTCRELELNVLDCTDVYGHKGLQKQCKDAYDDFSECIYEFKQVARVKAMRAERMRQYAAGERTKANLYAEPPKLDGYYKTYGRNID